MQNPIATVSFMFFHVLVLLATLRSGNETFWDYILFLFSVKMLHVNTVLFDMWLLYSQLKSINILRKLAALHTCIKLHWCSIVGGGNICIVVTLIGS